MVSELVLDGEFTEQVWTEEVKQNSLTANANGAQITVMGKKCEQGIAIATTIVHKKAISESINGDKNWYNYLNAEVRINNGKANIFTARNQMSYNVYSYSKTEQNADGSYTTCIEVFMYYADLSVTKADVIKIAVGGWFETGFAWLWEGSGNKPSHTLTEMGIPNETMTIAEFNQQVVSYGSNNWLTKQRARIMLSVKMVAGTKITFTGDPTVYGWALNEVDDNSQMPVGDQDSGWISGNSYITRYNNYPVIVMKKMSGGEFTQEELNVLHTYFQIEGHKISPTTCDNEGSLTQEEYNAQAVHFGSVPGPVNNKRARISFAIKMAKGTNITFTGDSKVYGWAIVETYNTASTQYAVDTGWLSKNTYSTQHEGAYPVITLKRIDGKAFTSAELATLKAMFKVEGEKRAELAEVERKEYQTNSVNHRGYCTIAPENTLSAYELSAKYGFSMVECDVQFTSDGVPVLLHDSTIDRTSNGSGNIEELTFEQVRTYDFGSWKSLDYAGEKIPSFDEFMALCSELQLHPYIEIKGTITAEEAQILIDIVKKYEMQGKVSYISFSFDALKLVSEKDNGARLGLVVSNFDQGVVNTFSTIKTDENQIFIDCYYTNVNETTVSLCQTASIPLEVWTVNSVDAVMNLHSYVSGVTSDWVVAGQILG